MAASTAGRQLFVGNLPFIVGWQDLKDLFREAGTVVRADVSISPVGKSRGFGTVLFSTVEEANSAITAFNNYEWHGRKIEVREDRAVSGAVGGAAVPNSNGNGNGTAHRSEADPAAPSGNVPLPGTSNDATTLNARALYVGNLPYSIGWQDLKDLFRNVGSVVRADIPTDYQGRSKGFGTVVMSTVEEARKGLVHYNGYELNGRRIEVREDRTFVEGAQPHHRNNQDQSGGYGAQSFPQQHGANVHGYAHQQNHNFQPQQMPQGGGYGMAGAPNAGMAGMPGNASTAGRVLFVGNLPFTVQWQELKDHFRQFGSVQRADVTQDGQGRSRGYGQVVMSTVDEAAAAVKGLNGVEFQGRIIEVREDKYAADASAPVAGTQVFVGNLPYSTRWQDLKDLFRPIGLNPIHADIMAEPGTGRSKGCGIVRFATREEAERSVQGLNGSNVAGRNIVVRLDKFA